MFKNTIRKEVIKAIEDMISRVEKDFKETCDSIDAEAFQKKADAKEAAVQSIIGKLV